MTRRRVEVTVDGTIFSFRGWQAHKLAVEAGLRPTFSGVCGWVADTKRLPELIAYLQHRNIAVEILDSDRTDIEIVSTTPSRSNRTDQGDSVVRRNDGPGTQYDDTAVHPADDGQFDLFGGGAA